MSNERMTESLVRDKLRTLAVMSMPLELFYPVGTITCIMVWIAGKPHSESDRKTWFGYWRDDGFVKTKHKGRIDQNETWSGSRPIRDYGHSLLNAPNRDSAKDQKKPLSYKYLFGS